MRITEEQLRTIPYAMEKAGFRPMRVQPDELPKYMMIDEVTESGAVALRVAAEIILQPDEERISNLWRDDAASQRAIRRYLDCVRGDIAAHDAAVQAVCELLGVSRHSLHGSREKLVTVPEIVAAVRAADGTAR